MACRNACSKVCGLNLAPNQSDGLLNNYAKCSQSLGSNPMATIDMPTALSARVINALKADPRTVDVRAQAPHFYALGARMLELFEEDEMVDVLSDVRNLCAFLAT